MADSEQSSPQEGNEIFGVAQQVHKQLVSKYGLHKPDFWVPTPDTVSILQPEQFDTEVGKLIAGEVPEEFVARQVAGLIGYADFKHRKLYVRNDKERESKSIALSLGHEELHLWFLRTAVDDGIPYDLSYRVNEAFIESLSLNALDLFDTSETKDDPDLDSRVNNYLPLKVIFDAANDGWASVVEACDGKDQNAIRERFKKQFGEHPPTGALRQINERYPTLHGTDFWGRVKDLGATLYTVGLDHEYQYRFPQIHSLIGMMLDWSKTRAALEKYLIP
ncbi:MAG: hypothetical protein HYV40_02265 [Candidatus Levybacteria bacterium]|nr:hypothetical protein [Candidatus Levybacteria bacterium]